MDLVLHIGRHKTGTTTIQRELAEQAPRFRAAGVLYPHTGRNPDKHFHHPFFKPLVEGGEQLSSVLLDQLATEAERAGAHTVILSSEVLSRDGVGQREVTAVATAFSSFRVRVVVYLRRQDDYLESVYAERIKQGLLAFPDTIDGIPTVLDYSRFLEPWAEAFGAAALRVRTFEQAKRRGLLADFLDAAEVPASGVELEQPTHANRRYPWAFLEALRVANRSRRARRLLTAPHVLAAVQRAAWARPALDAPQPLSSLERAALMARYAASNRQVARRFLGRERLFGEETRSRISADPPDRGFLNETGSAKD